MSKNNVDKLWQMVLMGVIFFATGFLGFSILTIILFALGLF